MSVLLPLIPSTLPPRTCYSNDQARLNGYAANLHAVLDGQSFFNFGPDVPAVEFQGFPWFRTTDGRWYFYDGAWISPRPKKDIDPNTRILYVGTTTDLLTYDGGSNEPLSDRSGPMWEVDTAFAGRSPIGPGNLPTSGSAIVVATNYGADQHTLVATELPATIPLVGNLNNYGEPPFNPTTMRILADDQDVDGQINVSTNFTIAGGGQPHNNLSPVRGCYLIKPTARLFYKV